LRYIWLALRGLFLGTLVLICAALMYLLVIMADPTEVEPPPTTVIEEPVSVSANQRSPSC
jgi:hypothetical protein